MFHRRRLLQYGFFIGISFVSSVYLWMKTAETRVTSESSLNPTSPPKALGSKSASPCGGIQDWPVSSRTSIEPFPKFELSESHFAGDGDMLKTHDWWDLWKADPNCTQYQVHQLKPGSHPRPGALVSFPGSGNSWIRSLLMGITGVYVTSAYVDEERFFRPNNTANSKYEIPIDCNCSLLQKTHDFSLDGNLVRLSQANRNKTLEKFHGKGILVIRNPFKAIKSYLNFIYGGMTGTAPPSAFQGEEWDNFLSRSVAGWETLNTVWIRGLKQGGIVYYERLRHEPRSELMRLVTMLGLNYDNDRLDCVLRHSKDNSFKRNTDAEQIDPYTASQWALIHKAIASVQLVLKERGLDPLPVQYYDLFDKIPKYGLNSDE